MSKEHISSYNEIDCLRAIVSTLTSGGGGSVDLSSPGPIGGTTPAAGTFTTLDTKGVVIMRDTTGAIVIEIRPDLATRFNTFVGRNAGSVVVAGGVKNTAFGFDSFILNTIGAVNVAVGYQTLRSNTEGSNNTGVGVEALFSNTTGANNTAIGYGALTANITGTGNTAVGMAALNSANAIGNSALGWNALKSTTSGSNNIAVGYETLQGNISGDSNTGIGFRALRNATTSNSTAVGNEALFSQTTGSNNTAVGFLALRTTLDGIANVAVGGYVLHENTSGNNNSAFGYGTLYGNTSGSSNSALGHEAGRYITGGETPNQTSGTSVYVGAGTKSLASGDANEIVIGYNAIGAGSNTATLGNTSITSTVLRGSVGIGAAAAASAVLDAPSTTKGFLPPRMTKAQRDAIGTPAVGLSVYQTDNTPGLRVYNGTNWMRYTETAD